MTILPACLLLPPPFSLSISWLREIGPREFACHTPRVSRLHVAWLTTRVVQRVVLLRFLFLSTHTHTRMGNISKLLRREEEETSATPKHTHTKQKKTKMIRTAWKIERFVVLCNTPMGGSERRRARSRPVSATYQHDRHDITAPPPNRTSCK